MIRFAGIWVFGTSQFACYRRAHLRSKSFTDLEFLRFSKKKTPGERGRVAQDRVDMCTIAIVAPR